MNENGTESEIYISAHWRARFLISLLLLSIILDMVAMTSDYFQARLLVQVKAGMDISESTIAANDNRQQVIGTLRWFIYVASALFFLIWIYRAYSNLKPLGAKNLKYSKWWAIGCFFIPVVNFFRPYQVVNELWKASNPRIENYDSISSPSRAPLLIKFWWAFWLVYNLIALMATRISSEAETVDDLIEMSWVNLVSDLLSATAALLATLVISRIDRRQDEKYRKLCSTETHAGEIASQN